MQNEWISVKDKLPELLELVEVKLSDGDTWIDQRFQNGEFSFDEFSNGRVKVTHWRQDTNSKTNKI